VLINGYNALTVELVVAHMRAHGRPPGSINDLGSWTTSVWKRRAGTLGEKSSGRALVEDLPCS